MSLLLEALKKAELAKQSASKPAADLAPVVVEEPLALEMEPVPAPPVMTRANLPDITQPLEILSEDLPSARRAEPEQSFGAQAPVATPATAFAPAEPAPAASTYSAAPQPAIDPAPPEETRQAAEPFTPEPSMGAERDAARQLFEAKEVEYNPKRPFYITIGVLVLAGVAYGGYVWWEM